MHLRGGNGEMIKGNTSFTIYLRNLQLAFCAIVASLFIFSAHARLMRLTCTQSALFSAHT